MGLLTGVMIIRSCALNTAHVKLTRTPKNSVEFFLEDIPGLSIDAGDSDKDEDLISD